MKQLDVLVDPANKESPLHNKSTRPTDVMEVYMTRGQLYAYQGDMARLSRSGRLRIELPCRMFRGLCR